MTISALPTPPTRSDPATFATRADAFLTALPTFQTEANALAAAVNADLVDATTQAGIATTKAGTATTQAGTATTQAGISTAQAVISTAQAVISTAQAATSVANAATATTQNAAAGVSASAASSSASQAATARDLAIAAWSASTAPAETLASISQSLHIGAVVKAIVYDTSLDSETGKWRKRCADKSWYTETLGGDRWIGQYATIALAWAAAGSTTGAVYQASATAGAQTSGKYYTPTSSTAVTEVSRGISREFPAIALIVAESGRVVIYDGSAAGCPMWMVFSTTANYALNSGTITSVAALNGRVVVGMSTQEIELGFVADAAYKRNATNYTVNSLPLGSRNTAGTFNVINATGIIVNASVNDVAITVLDNAPIDLSTGLPTPTIACATAGGVSVILDSGTVRNSLSTTASYGISFDDLKRVVWNTTTEINRSPVPPLAASFTASVVNQDIKLSSSAYSTSNVSIMPAVTSAGGKTAKNAVASSAGLTVYKAGQTAPSVMLAAITNAYNSGWMPGDIRLATLADSTAETITESGELITNGTFDTDTTGWTTNAPVTATWNASGYVYLARNSGPATEQLMQTVIGLVVGKTYTVSVTVIAASHMVNMVSIYATIATSIGASTVNGYTGVVTGNFVAPATTVVLSVGASGSTTATATLDNISVKLATQDRSVKNNGLVINGSLTKTAVASGASLVAYSGWSADNYLERPYTSDADFSIAGFSGILWLKEAPNSAIEYLINRDSATPAQSIRLWVSVAGYIVFELYDGTTTRTATGTVAVDDTTWKCVIFDYFAGTLNVYVNDALYATATGAALLTLSNTAAVTRIGLDVAGGYPATNASLALCRMSATVMSSDQRSFVYRTELPLFQVNAKCLIDGTSTAVTALAFDDTTYLLQVGTSWGRSSFKDLLRVDSEATTTGALTSLSASQGVILTGGTSGKVYVPAMLLRDELRRKDEAKKALGKVPVFFEFDTASFTSPTTNGSAALTGSSVVGTVSVGMGVSGTGIPAGTTIISVSGTAYVMSANATVTDAGAVAITQNGYVLQAGYTTKAVYGAGTLKRVGSTKDYTTSTNGFKETVTFGTSPGSAVWVSVMAVKG